MMLADALVQIVFGWPFVLAGEALLVAGLARRRFGAAAVGLALTAPFFLYLASYPPPVRYLTPLCLLASAAAIVARRRGSAALAAVLVLPALVAMGVVALVVVSQ